MSIFKACFTKQSKFTVQYSARSTLARCPPTGRTSDPEDPNKEVWKSQFSCGDQEDRSRIPFWNSGFAACVQCGERNIWRVVEKAGIREDGQAYGTKVFSCMTKGCRWETSFKYDDGCNCCVHFEARGWSRGILHYPVAFIMIWADKHKLGSKVIHIIFLNKIDGHSQRQVWCSALASRHFENSDKQLFVIVAYSSMYYNNTKAGAIYSSLRKGPELSEDDKSPCPRQIQKNKIPDCYFSPN